MICLAADMLYQAATPIIIDERMQAAKIAPYVRRFVSLSYSLGITDRTSI
jgi:hypothetical protein